ncbi:MAG: lysine biosynthesis protein LysX [Trueperaceae bacterium]|nr:lysine biosynthesis protein LysX [Trueperaceae bacterium]
MTTAPAVRIALVHDRLRPEERLLLGAFDRLGVDVRRVYAPDLRLEAGAPWPEGDVAYLRTLSHARTLAIAQGLEASGVHVVNPAHVVATCGDKWASSAALAAAGVPQPRTVLAFDRATVLAAAEDLGWPVVLKPVVGSWGRMVARLHDVDAVDAVLEHKRVLGGPTHQLFYVQEHVAKPGRDLRAFVVGDRVVAAIAREGDDWRTNTARGATVRGVAVTPDLEATALAAARAVAGSARGGLLAVDLLEADRGLLVGEVNHGLEFRNSIEPTGVDLPLEIAAYLRDVAAASAPDAPAARAGAASGAPPAHAAGGTA